MNANPVMDICAADKVGGEIHLWRPFGFGLWFGLWFWPQILVVTLGAVVWLMRSFLHAARYDQAGCPVCVLGA
jgi:hypothetical protein